MALIDDVRLAIRVTTTAFDDELEDLIESGKLDLQRGGVDESAIDEEDALIKRALITYCKAHFGDPENYERFKASYDEQKMQLGMADGYTDWLDEDE